MNKKKQRGGYLKGPSHNKGGVDARIAGKEPVELEGGEYIMSVDATNRIGKDKLDQMNFGKKMPMGGRVQPSMAPRFKKQSMQGMRYMKHGGNVSISDNKAGIGEIHTTYIKDGYEAGK